MAAMISVGAQANSNQISANAVSFSNYSAGLIDRISEDKLTINSRQKLLNLLMGMSLKR
jgi:hypothetical protein